MASSAIQPNPPDPGSGTKSSQQSPASIAPRMLYSRVVQNHRDSLMHQASRPVVRDPTEPTKVGQDIYTRIWRPSGSPSSTLPSVYFDVSSRREPLAKVMSLLVRQYPKNRMVLTQREGPRVVVELFLIQAEITTALELGLTFADGTRIIPARSLHQTAQIVKVRLSQLPCTETDDELLSSLQFSLAPYGRVMDCGIYRDQNSGAYMSNGFAVLDRQPIPDQQPFSPLAHKVTWHLSEGYFLAKWSTMPLHCASCHEEGHHVRHCPHNPRNSPTCYVCHQKGHISYTCPDRSNNRGKRRKTAKPQPTSTGNATEAVRFAQRSAFSEEAHTEDGQPTQTSTPVTQQSHEPSVIPTSSPDATTGTDTPSPDGSVADGMDIVKEDALAEALDQLVIDITTETTDEPTFAPFYVLNIYAPATSPRLRRRFYATLLASPIFASPPSEDYHTRLIIGGDFNYNYHDRSRSVNAPAAWHSMLAEAFTDLHHRHHHILTFAHVQTDAEVQYLERSWTDHALLSFHLDINNHTFGKGYWRGNPTFTRLKEFRRAFAQHLSHILPHVSSAPTAQLRWEQ
ncbi:hypothetical protein BCR43DRAFT_515351 [Syncephalastrum racemosum]|uniref:CCHC-type domain-containing protein n=1 Tax=Syncephalastrum racemosum TaxID=13706 RepID=A0A1X2H960_SYNRA|nr:hypothetical protein BCR43DRAFT_515351 [Syncephalastrum racemosum]